MATAGKYQVNLDALFLRADLFEEAVPVIKKTSGIRLSDLGPGPIYDMLRKPDFQRETNSWNPKQVAKLIETFANDDIIPAVILWQNGNQIFIVDGAHRLSALAAWVNRLRLDVAWSCQIARWRLRDRPPARAMTRRM